MVLPWARAVRAAGAGMALSYRETGMRRSLP
jgi:hypothetical protein